MPLTVAARPHWLLLAGGTALVYFLVGAAALPLALPPGQVTPLFPSAGIALVALLLYGRRMALGVLVGALALNLLPAGHREQAAPWGAALPLILALSAALQAVLGAVLVRRYVQEPLALNTPGQVTRFYLAGGAAACLLNASVVTAVLWA
ncbi:MAG: signal transduction histidine kinaselike protein, partial [Rhizobacter sp.]|nr:signal transduction histidine kinaselike protein [Rhizobacter sp.]